MQKVVLIVFCCLLHSCVRQSAVQPTITGDGWRAEKIGHYPTDNRYFVVAVDHEAATNAQKDLCNVTSYICSIQPLTSFVIERNRK